jgi:hypothetical protein
VHQRPAIARMQCTSGQPTQGCSAPATIQPVHVLLVLLYNAQSVPAISVLNFATNIISQLVFAFTGRNILISKTNQRSPKKLSNHLRRLFRLRSNHTILYINPSGDPFPLNYSMMLVIKCKYSSVQRIFYSCIRRKGIAWPQSHFPHSCACERFIYSQDRSIYCPAAE